jgi:hypothetical protein
MIFDEQAILVLVNADIATSAIDIVFRDRGND